MKKLLILSMLLASFTATYLFADKVLEKKSYKVAVLLPLSGEKSFLGSSMKEGFEAFLKFMQDAQGFEKFKFDILILDTESDESKALQLADYVQKHSSEFLLIAGASSPKVVDKLIKIAEEKKIPYLFPLRSSFQEKLSQFYFPVLPSYYNGYKFLIHFLDQKKMAYKLIYDEKTKENAFLLTDSSHLLEMNDPNFDKKLAEGSILFVSPENVERLLKNLGKKTRKFMNYDGIDLALHSKERNLWENVLFLNWVKTMEWDSVKFFKQYFKKLFNKEADNYHMSGWIMMDLVYETVSKAVDSKKGLISSLDFVKELESFSLSEGYNSGCAYQVYYEPFSLSKPYSRLGISGLYFLQYQNNEFEIVSDFDTMILK